LAESPRFLLAVRTASALRIFAVTGINPDAASAARHVDVAETANTVVALFTDGYAMSTILFWIMFFASLPSLYLIGFWLPTVLHLEGLSPSDAVFAASLYSAGGSLSVLLLGPFPAGSAPIVCSLSAWHAALSSSRRSLWVACRISSFWRRFS